MQTVLVLTACVHVQVREQRAEYLTAARPEIIHMFRPPEKRPPTVVSTVFVALVAAPVLVLLVLWSRLGINLDALARVPKIHALVFHVALIGLMIHMLMSTM